MKAIINIVGSITVLILLTIAELRTAEDLSAGSLYIATMLVIIVWAVVLTLAIKADKGSTKYMVKIISASEAYPEVYKVVDVGSWKLLDRRLGGGINIFTYEVTIRRKDGAFPVEETLSELNLNKKNLVIEKL